VEWVSGSSAALVMIPNFASSDDQPYSCPACEHDKDDPKNI
jgi:hypothetical protein